MKCLDTRGGAAVALSQAIACGLAPSGGLYVPESLPLLDMADFAADHDLAAVAQRALAPFFAADVLAAELPAICRTALNFDAPLSAVESPAGGTVPDTHVLELYHGPTAAFKDYGARFLAACLQALAAAGGQPASDQRAGDQPTGEVTILVATSGDTGAAVAAAFHRQPGVRVVILYPHGRVSRRQAHQWGCFGDNIHGLSVAGSFDDCQRLVKTALNDTELRRGMTLSSANSISLGRLLPQLSYYAWAALRHQRGLGYGRAGGDSHAPGRELNLVIPTGNLGNALAAVMARRIGFPLGRIVFATNANPVLSAYFGGAEYAPQPSVATLANAMDVGAPSNFERLRWWYEDEAQLRQSFHARAVSDDQIRTVIAHGESRYGRVWCPHTATAVCVLEQLRAQGESGHWAIVATAHPAKFETIVEPLVAHRVPVPPALQAMLERPSHSQPLAADEAAFKAYLMGLALPS